MIITKYISTFKGTLKLLLNIRVILSSNRNQLLQQQKFANYFIKDFNGRSGNRTLFSTFHILSLSEKTPNKEFFLVHIFLYSDLIWIFTPYAGKYGPEKTPYLDAIHVSLKKYGKYALLSNQSTCLNTFRC